MVRRKADKLKEKEDNLAERERVRADRLNINEQCKLLKAEARELGLEADCQFSNAGLKVSFCCTPLPL